MSELDNLPIDIHSSKLLDWLQSRRHCAKDWQQQVHAIREKINRAIQDMPEHQEIVNLLSGIYINYFHCLRIVGILKETEVESKNIFGRYSSQRMKDWQEIVKLYEKDNVYLAEAAQILQRLVTYEIPGIKKQIVSANKTHEDCVKKEADYQKQSKDAERQFQIECKKISIPGTKIKSELYALAQNLPEFFVEIAEKCKSLSSIADFYREFRKVILQKTKIESQVLPMLQFVIDHGNVTHYEYRTGKRPTAVEPFRIRIEEDSNIVNTDEGIDFGAVEEEPRINFDGDVDAVIELVESAESAAGSHLEMTNEEDGVARGSDAVSIFQHRQTQQALLTDLAELEAFLRMRISESKSDRRLDFLFISNPKIDLPVVELEKMLAKCKEITVAMVDPYKKHLYQILSSERYLDKLTEELTHKRNQIQKYTQLAKLMREKQAEAYQEAKNLQPKLDLMIKRTKELQKQIESDISKRYNSRPVNIMGGISAAVAS